MKRTFASRYFTVVSIAQAIILSPQEDKISLLC